jgi:hypothetical protein
MGGVFPNALEYTVRAPRWCVCSTMAHAISPIRAIERRRLRARILHLSGHLRRAAAGGAALRLEFGGRRPGRRRVGSGGFGWSEAQREIKTGTKQEIQVVLCQLLLTFQNTCASKHRCNSIRGEATRRTFVEYLRRYFRRLVRVPCLPILCGRCAIYCASFRRSARRIYRSAVSSGGNSIPRAKDGRTSGTALGLQYGLVCHPCPGRARWECGPKSGRRAFRFAARAVDVSHTDIAQTVHQ